MFLLHPKESAQEISPKCPLGRLGLRPGIGPAHLICSLLWCPARIKSAWPGGGFGRGIVKNDSRTIRWDCLVLQEPLVRVRARDLPSGRCRQVAGKDVFGKLVGIDPMRKIYPCRKTGVLQNPTFVVRMPQGFAPPMLGPPEPRRLCLIGINGLPLSR